MAAKQTKEQAAAKKLNPSITPANHDREQYKVATFAGRGRRRVK